VDDTTQRLERIERQIAALVVAMEPAGEPAAAEPMEDLVAILGHLCDRMTDMAGEMRALRSTVSGLSRGPGEELSIAA
jgi:hypothetical protein